MKISGCSIEMDGGYIVGSHRIMRGMFKFVGTYGLPLEVVIDFLNKRNITIDWVDYCTDALKDGHNPSTIKARILEAVGDVFGDKYREGFKEELGLLFDAHKN